MLDATSTTSPAHSGSTPVSKLRTLAKRAWAWWQDASTGSRSDEVGVAVEPFCFWHGQRSALTGEGGAEPSLVAGYAFHTGYIASTGGTIRFRIRITGLKATHGKLIVSVNAVDGRGLASSHKPKIFKFSLRKLAASGDVIEVSELARPGHSYAVMGVLSDDSDAQADSIAISVIGGDSNEALMSRLDAAREGFLAAPGEGPLAKLIVDRQATLAEPLSQMCTAHQMHEPIFGELVARLGIGPTLHRKQWEFAYILRTLDFHGKLQPGSRGLGFGVGIEPMSSVFAAAGCDVVATDLPEDDARATVWNETDQLGSDLERIYSPGLCDRDTFFERVRYRPVDMNAIPADLTGFDFCWSSCAYEHLGSIKAGLDFIENTLKTLKPGGISVHTTELNLSSNENTLDHGSTVLFRRRDFEMLVKRLAEQGHEVIPITFDSGDTELDRVIDLPPYTADSHLKLQLLRWVSTSFGLVVRKAG